MKEIIEQFINQVEQDQNLSSNTKIAYKSDLNDLLEYVANTNSQIQDINHLWVKDFLKYLESVNQERNSYNRRASTFRIFLRFLYRNRLAPTNYSLIVDNLSPFERTLENSPEIEEIKKIIEDTRLKTEQRLILLMIGRLGLTATQIALLNTHQVDFEKRSIQLSDIESILLPNDIFTVLREYLIEIRSNLPGANEHLSIFLSEKGEPLAETDIYKLVKNLSQELNFENKITTRDLKKLSNHENKADIMSMQREIFNIISGP